MKRKDVQKEDTWDLTKFFKTKEEYNSLYKETLKDLDKLVSYKGIICKDANTLYEFLELNDKISLNIELIYVYSYLYHYSDTTDSEGKLLRDKADKLNDIISEKTSFVDSELLSTPYDTIKKFIKEKKELKKYAFYLEKAYRYQKHTLSEAEERIISLANIALGTPDNAFSALDNADCKFDNVIVDGKELELNHSNYIKYMTSQDRDLRKQVFDKYYDFYINHKNTIAEMYKGQIKEDLFISKVRKFNSPLEMSLYSDDIDVSVYKNLIKTLHDNMKPMYDYMKLRKEYMNLDELHMYDIYADMVKGSSKTFTFDEAKNCVLEAVKPLGDKYVSDLSKAFTNRWIDRYPNDGKRSGAYQWGSFGVDPYVSLNFEGTEDSVSTLAHELGHAMHSYYSDNKQNHVDAQYPIFLAEIASTVNEVLLNEYFINNAKDDNEKLLYITSFLDKFRATVYRQTMFAEFEMIAHDMEQNGEALTEESLSNVYYDLNKLYYGKDVVSDDAIRYEWSRIPHFYTSFYVYKYATGFCAALAIASDILGNVPGAKDRYLEFLSSGGSNYPLNTLKKCNVDMESSEPILKGIKMFEDKINQARKIIEGEKDGK
jgi:oligoendopeptidase F